jgi:2-dehydropantoate 2-reductase
MKIAVIGAGAIGGLLAVRLAAAGHEVSAVARGPNLRAIRERGMTLVEPDGTRQTQRMAATDRISDLSSQEVVFVALKAHQVSAVARDIAALLAGDAIVVTLQNGIPWWYFQRSGGPYEGSVVGAVDPGGVISRAIPAQRIIGSLAYPAAELIEPGVVELLEGNRFPVGELDGSESERVSALSQLLIGAGFKSPVLTDIRSEIWLKLWGNLSFNPISALTHATLEDICRSQATRALARDMMKEAEQVATRLGATFRVDIERRIDGAERVGAHKTSMLQDLEAGRALELDALVKSVVELGVLTGVPTPLIAHVHGLTALLAASVARGSGRLRVEALAA